jgi:hypothetical protein
VLRLGQRAAEPGRVGQVGEDAGLRQCADDLLAKNVLVTDVDRNLLAGYG